MEVKIVERSEGKALIEWREDGCLRRGIIPEEVVDGNFVDDDLLSLAISFGIDFEFLLEQALDNVTPASIACRLHNAGICTYDDMRSNPAVVRGVIMAAYGVDFQTLYRIAEDNKTRR